MFRSCLYAELFSSVFSSIAVAQQAPATKVETKFDYKLVKPAATANDSAARPFSEAIPHVVMDMIAIKDGSELVVTEGNYLESGCVYKVDLKDRWRDARIETEMGICSIVSLPARNEVVSSSWDSMIRFHDADSLQTKATIPVNRSASRLAATPDELTLAIVNEGFLDADQSDGRTLWSVDIKSRSQKSIIGTVPFRGFNIGFSPDGKNLAVCGGLFENPSGTLAIWDVATASQKFEIKRPNCLYKLAYSTDGKWLVATGVNGTVAVNTREGEQHATSPLRGHTLHILPRTNNVLVADSGNTFRLLSLPDLKTLKTVTNEFGSINAFASVADNTSFITATQMGLQRWSSSNWKSEPLIGGRIPVNSGNLPVFLKKFNLIAVSRGKELQLCDADSGTLLNSHAFDTKIVKTVADEKSDRFGVILDNDAVLALDVLTGRVKKLGQIPSGSFSAITRDLAAVIFVSPNGDLTRFQLDNGAKRAAPTKLSATITNLVIASGGEICCGLASGDVVMFDAGLTRTILQVPKAAVESIVSLDWSSQQHRLAIVEKTGRLSVFERDPQGLLKIVMRRNLSSPPTAVALSEASSLVAVGHSNGTVSLLASDDSTSTTSVPARIVGPTISCLIMNDDKGFVCSNSNGVLSRIKLNAQPISSTHRIEAKDNQKIHTACMSLKGDECYIAVDRNLEVRSTETWKKTQTLHGHRDTIMRVRLSPDGKWMASTGHDSLALVRKRDGNQWEIDGTVFLPARGHRIEWSPDGRWLLVGTDARQICVIDVTTWQIAHTFDVPFVPNTFSFSADGRNLVSSGINSGDPGDICTVQVWDTIGWKQSKWSDPKTMRGHRHGVEAIAMQDDGKKFYSVAADSEMLEWSTAARTFRKIRNLPLSGTSFSLLPDPRYAIVSWHFASLAVLDVRDGSIALQTEGHVGDGDNVLMRDVFVSRDGQWAISCAAADLGQGVGSARLWRIGKSTKSRE